MLIQQNKSLKQYNSFGINAIARNFVILDSLDSLEELITDHEFSIKNAHFILGGGSNILFTSPLIDGWVLKNEMKGITLVGEDEDHYFVEVAAGENWHQFVLYCISKGYAGIENLSLIPGCAGASPIQNIGAYGVEIKDVFDSLDLYHLREKCVIRFSASECMFGYRESIFKTKLKNQFVILKIRLRLNKKPSFKTSYGAVEQELEKMGVQELTIQQVSEAVIRIRSSKLPDPKKIGNAGSFFKNPIISNDLFQKLKPNFPDLPGYPAANGLIKIAAGWLIEKAGWKGYRIGDAGCHALQALVLVNFGNATGKEIYELSSKIIHSIENKFGIVLEREVNIL